MGMGGGMMGGGSAEDVDRELINLSSSGQERWRVSFDDGWPMMPVTDEDLVVVSLADDWWTGTGGMGDGGWDHGGGMMGGKTLDGSGSDGHATLLAFDLTTGTETWRLELYGGMISMPQFSPDGSRLYVTVRDMDVDQIGGGSMRQGDAAGAGMLMSTTVVAIGRGGSVLWTLDLADDDHSGGPMNGGGF
jgi:outer membrane protein assembly factor BamB